MQHVELSRHDEAPPERVFRTALEGLATRGLAAA
jgi:hypothetical protein